MEQLNILDLWLKELSFPCTYRALSNTVRGCFRDAGIPNFEKEAALLVMSLGRLSPTQYLLELEQPIDTSVTRETLAALLKRRIEGEPLAYLLGEWEFWSLPIQVSPATLIPRVDSECLIEEVCSLKTPRDVFTVVDLGTGSGCLLLSLLHEFPRAVGVGTDRSFEALNIAQENAARLKLSDRSHWVCTNWLDGIALTADLIVANPPYIPTGEVEQLDRSVKDYEPRLALDGGPKGLESYTAIVQSLQKKSHLFKKNTIVVFEIGYNLEEEVKALCKRYGLCCVNTRKDTGGHVRVLSLSPQSDRRLTSFDPVA